VNKTVLAFATLLAILAGCSDAPDNTITSAETASSDTSQVNATDSADAQLLDFSEVASSFHHAAQSSTENILALCLILQKDIESFLLTPTDDAQLKAQASFLNCYQNYRAAALFFQQPFGLADGKEFSRLVGIIDTRPFLPGYIDGIPEYPFSGLIHELDIPINASTLRSQHRLMDEESASVGFPVIEFFLWRTPVQENWLTASGSELETTVKRRSNYLRVATTLLIENLTDATNRWKENSDFSKLPERAQLSVVLKSLQRQTMVALLAEGFEEIVLIEPDWYHPALISGQGRSYPIALLKRIQSFVGTPDNETAFTVWFAKQEERPFEIKALQEAIAQALSGIEKLPENYPFDAVIDENWLAARQQIAQIALHFSQLSEHNQVAIITD